MLSENENHNKWFFHPTTPRENEFLAKEILLGEHSGFEVRHTEKLCADGKKRDLWEGYSGSFEEARKVIAANAEFGYKIAIFLTRDNNPPQRWVLHKVVKNRKMAVLKRKIGMMSHV